MYVFYAVTNLDSIFLKESNLRLDLLRILLISLRNRCVCVLKAFAHGAMGRVIDPSW